MYNTMKKLTHHCQPASFFQLNAAPIDPLDALNNVVELVVLVMLVVAVSELVTIPLLRKRIHKNHIESNKNWRHPPCNKQPIHHFAPKKMANALKRRKPFHLSIINLQGTRTVGFREGKSFFDDLNLV